MEKKIYIYIWSKMSGGSKKIFISQLIAVVTQKKGAQSKRNKINNDASKREYTRWK